MATNSTSDSFPALMDNNLPKVVGCVLSAVNVVVAPPLLYFIVWFERFGNDLKRTLVNMLTSVICCTFIFYLLTCQSLEVLRFSFGPLPPAVCCFQNLIKCSVLCVAFLLTDAIICARYVYIFWLKNPASFHDSFWCCFVTTWIYGTATVLMLAVSFLTDSQTMGFFICSGTTTKDLKKLTSDVFSVVVGSSLLLHIAVNLRIKYYKIQNRVRPFQQQQPSQTASTFLKDFDVDSLANSSSCLACILIFVATLICIHRLDHIVMTELNDFPNYLCAYFINLISPCLAMDIWMLLLFRKEKVRKAFKEEWDKLVQF